MKGRRKETEEGEIRICVAAVLNGFTVLGCLGNEMVKLSSLSSNPGTGSRRAVHSVLHSPLWPVDNGAPGNPRETKLWQPRGHTGFVSRDITGNSRHVNSGQCGEDEHQGHVQH